MQVYSKIGSLLLIACCVAYCLYTREIVLVFKASSMFAEPCNMCLAPFPMMGNGGQQHPPVSKAHCLCVCALNSCTLIRPACLLTWGRYFVCKWNYKSRKCSGDVLTPCLQFFDISWFHCNHPIEYVSLLIIDRLTDWMQLWKIRYPLLIFSLMSTDCKFVSACVC